MKAKVLPLRRPRKEVEHTLVRADAILLRMYQKKIDEIYCMDCTTSCEERDASCYIPVKVSIIDVS